ncbi:hypothetical protein BGX21_000218 [Mortierella sp. AD011]|nr:hypothetical protein BGX21_000218 [Mortierella sp. AD011]
MGRLLPTCIASNRDSIYFIARAVSSDNVNGEPLIVLAKSEQFPTNLNNVSWSIVSTVPMDQLKPFILPFYTGNNLLSVQCVVDDDGVFTVGVMKLGHQVDGVGSSIRYDPNAALIDKSTTTHGNGTVGGLGEWTVASDPSNLIEDFRYVNVKNPINGNNSVYRIQFNRYEATTVIKFGPEVRGNRTETDKRITLLILNSTTYMVRDTIYSLNGTSITDDWVSESNRRTMDYLISVPSQASGKQSNHSILTFNDDGLYSVNLSTLNHSIVLQALPDIVVSNNVLTHVPPPPVECYESCHFAKAMTRVIIISSAIGILLLLCCLGFCIRRYSVNRYKDPPAGRQNPDIVSVRDAENGGEPNGDNDGEVVEMETVTAEEGRNAMNDQVESADSHEHSSGNVISEVVEDRIDLAESNMQGIEGGGVGKF